MRILAALSGGVDSAVCAALLTQAGHEVVAAHLNTGAESEQGSAAGRSCCGADDARDARAVANRLGLPFYVVDVRTAFAREVVEPFIAAYAAGRTPNPCVACNRGVKFGRLLEIADSLGAAGVATGHYARVERGPTGRMRLLRARDAKKDQTYVLHALSQDQLARAWFPLGTWTKSDVRAQARRLELPVADKPDSQELCFVPEGDVRGWLKRHAPAQAVAGPFLDASSQEVGRHEGALGFTRGQRRGLPALGEPRYVTRVNPAAGTVEVGPRAALLDSVLEAQDVNWTEREGLPVGESLAVAVQVRHASAPSRGTLTSTGPTSVRVELETPIFGAAKGQALVAWQDDAVVCGGPLSAHAALTAG